ncbi:HisA/HisF-related TIM barrel protein [Spongiactinospora sp. 9N601]|uniref:HisA/HisF-related TIM barrel protein n=1 Tax=Spongiactinospora sp. 9N601 TaxID=3375149 RepID=UPI003792D8B1
MRARETPYASAIIPCIDVAGGRAVPPAGIGGLSDPADPAEIASVYAEAGADRIFVDAQEPWAEHETFLPLLKRMTDAGADLWVTVDNGFMPSLGAAEALLGAGAAAVGMSTTSVERPALLHTFAQRHGAERVIGVMNASRVGGDHWNIAVRGGGQATDLDAVTWARMLADLGAGCLLVNSLDMEGTGRGYDIPLTRAVADAVPVPVIASGGCGTLEHLHDGLTEGHAQCVLVNKMAHSGDHTIGEMTDYLRREGPAGRAEVPT